MNDFEQRRSTTDVLRDAITDYAYAVRFPCFLPGVDGFADSRLGEATSEYDGRVRAVLITTLSPDSMEVTVNDPRGPDYDKFYNIDLPPEGTGQPAVIVRPGFYDGSGNLDGSGEFGRPAVETLAEPQIKELIMDVYSAKNKTPADRLRHND